MKGHVSSEPSQNNIAKWLPIVLIVVVVVLVSLGIYGEVSGKLNAIRRERVLQSEIASIPDTDHGIFAVMQNVSEVTDAQAYRDGMFQFLSNTWPEQIDDLGIVSFDTEFSADLVGYEPSHTGHLSMDIEYDETAQVILSQTLDFGFCCDWNIELGNVANEKLDEYLGITLAPYVTWYNSWYCGFGVVSVYTQDVAVQLSECKVGKDSHIHIAVHLEDKNVEAIDSV